MLQRSAMAQLAEWKSNRTNQMLMVMGARQMGKTTLVREFAKQNYESVAELNFFENPSAKGVLSQASNVDDFVLRLSVLTGVDLVPEKTLLFMDEVQECQNALTWMKFFAERIGVDTVESGSLLGLAAFTSVRSLPVGFMQKMKLYPLTFKEFCFATGFSQKAWDAMVECVNASNSVPDFIHQELMSRFRRYLFIGGIPDAVQSFVDSGQIGGVRNAQGAIVELYEDDIAKYVDSPMESRQIKMIYRSIPGQLNAPSKRFRYARLGKNLRFANMETSLGWLSSAGVSIEATRVGELSFPFGLSEDRTSFKLFMNDVGLLSSQLKENVALEILENRTAINYGSVFENYVVQELVAYGREPYLLLLEEVRGDRFCRGGSCVWNYESDRGQVGQGL